MDRENPECDAAVAGLRRQAHTVTLQNSQNSTWYVADEGIYTGYIASSDELVELRRAKKLNIRGIKERG